MSFWENFTNFAPRNAVKLRLIALQFAANGLTISVVFSPKSCAFVIRLVVRDVVLGMGKNSILLTKQIFIFNLVLMSLRKLLLLIVASLVTFAINAQVTASGTVYDENNEEVIGATVIQKGKPANGTSTDIEGKFTLNVPSGAHIIVTYMGYEPYEVAAGSGLKITLKPNSDANVLEEVVVTGYQKVDKRLFTGATTAVDATKAKLDGVADVSRSLEGRAAGVTVQNVSGTFGTAPKIRVRGATSIYGDAKPLWVVDGVILSDNVEVSADDLSSGDANTLIASAVAGLNADDIESFQILKDGSATSIYGAKANAGVIVITTKTGRKGHTQINYTGEFTYRLKPNYRDFNISNSQEQMSIFKEMEQKGWLQFASLVNGSSTGIYGRMYNLMNQYNATNGQFGLPNTRAAMNDYLRQAEFMNTDWFDILCHNSFSHDHSVSVSGGSSKVRYYTSIGYTDQDDVINNTMNRRYTAMAKIDFDLTKKLKVQFNLNGYLNNRQYAQSDNNPINYAYNTSRAIPAYNSDGSYAHYLKAGNKGFYNFSILNELDNSYNKQETNAVTATANVRYQATDDLFFNAVFSANISNSNLEGWWGEDTFYASNLREAEMGEEPSLTSTMPYGGELSLQKNRNVGWTARLQGNYNKYLGENKHHNINVALGLEASSSNYKGDNYTQRGYYHDRGRTFASSIPLDYASYWSILINVLMIIISFQSVIWTLLHVTNVLRYIV